MENIIDFGDAPVDAWGGGEGLVEIGRDAIMSAQDYTRRKNEAEQKRDREVRDRTTRDLSRIQTTHGATPSSADGTTATSSTGGTTPTTTGGPQVQTPSGGTGTTTPTKTGETPPPKPPGKPEQTKTPVKTEPPPTSTIKPSTVDFPDSSGRFKIMVHFPKGAGKSYKNEKVGDDNVIVIMCPGYGKFVSNEPVELSVLGDGIGKWTVYANRDLSDPTRRQLLETLTNMSSDTYYYVVIYDRNRNDLSVTYFKVRATK